MSEYTFACEDCYWRGVTINFAQAVLWSTEHEDLNEDHHVNLEQLYEDVILEAQKFLDDTGPDRICGYCSHPRNSEFCRTSHPAPEAFN